MASKKHRKKLKAIHEQNMYVRFGSTISEQQIINRFNIGPDPISGIKASKMSPEKLEEFKKRWMSMMKDIEWSIPIISMK